MEIWRYNKTLGRDIQLLHTTVPFVESQPDSRECFCQCDSFNKQSQMNNHIPNDPIQMETSMQDENL